MVKWIVILCLVLAAWWTSAQAQIVSGNAGSATTPSGTAGGDLSGTYPNPTVKSANTVAAFNPSVTGHAGPTGNASILLTPPFQGSGLSTDQTVGTFCQPSVTYASLTNLNAFWACYNMAWGNGGSPVPSGTKGAFSGFEANITTSQAVADSNNPSHGFGFTGVANSTASIDGADLALTANGGNVNGVDVSITNNTAGGTQFGYYAFANAGSQTSSAAFRASGSQWKLDFADQGQSTAAESSSFKNFIGVGDGTLTNPFITLGSNGGNTYGFIGTYDNFPFRIYVNNTTLAANFSTTLATFSLPVIHDLGTVAALPSCTSGVAGQVASVSNNDAACAMNAAPAHSTCTVGTNCFTCQVQCAESGSSTYAWLIY